MKSAAHLLYRAFARGSVIEFTPLRTFSGLKPLLNPRFTAAVETGRLEAG
jgi:hypothetical protein